MSAVMEDSIYPVLVYLFDEQGYHPGPSRLTTKEAFEIFFKTVIMSHIRKKLEVRITDTGDSMLFHSYNGCIKWDGINHHECVNCKEN